MKYRIGDVQKILGISAETLRFFESKGLITPERNYVNNYRTFNSLDLNKIVAYKFYRSMEFSLEESLEMINKMTNVETGLRIKSKLTEIQSKAAFYNNLVLRMQELSEVYAGAEEVMGQPSLKEDLNGFYFCCNQINAEFDTSTAKMQKVRKWLDELPFVNLAVHIPTASAPIGSIINYGYSIQTNYAEISNKLMTDSALYFPPGKRVHVICRIPGEKDLSFSDLEPMFDYIQKNKLKIINDIFGRIINEDEEPDGKVRYFELWAPVE